MKAVWRAALTLGLGLACAAPVRAATVNPQDFTPAEQAQCQSDVFRLCNEFVADDDLIAACMKKKQKQLSPECRKVFESHKAKAGK